MISAATVAALEKAGLAYILGVRERSTKEVRNEVIEDDGWRCRSSFRARRARPSSPSRRRPEGAALCVCRNEEEARKDADRRAAILAGLDRKLAHGDKALVSNKGFRRFVKTIGSGNFSIDYDKAEADAKFDGLFVLRTNTSCRPCRSSCAIGTCWRWRTHSTKALLTTRPIFHKTDAAIRSHIFLQLPCSVAEEGAVQPRAAARRTAIRMAAHRR